MSPASIANDSPRIAHPDVASSRARSPLTWVPAGAALLILSVVPLYDWLRDPRTGLAGRATAEMAAAASNMVWAGALFCVAVGLCAARLISPERTRVLLHTLSKVLLRVGGRAFACAVAIASFAAALITERWIFRGQPVLIDAITQLTHARYLAAGLASAPADPIGFFRMQQAAPVPGGWVSQYPPLHVALLALGERIGAVWIVGPAMLACALFFTARATDRLLPARAAVRAGLILGALSPFMLAHAATYMSHTTAAACIGIALYALARARTARLPNASKMTASAEDAVQLNSTWLLVCGLAVGAAFATRPLTGLTVGVVIALAIVFDQRSPAYTPTAAAARAVAIVIAGALPIAIAVAAYNAHFFGSPFRFGYDVALGPHAGLGFGIDPWGNVYGIRQALGYTAAELSVLSLQLFETPLPLVALAGVYLVSRRILAWPEGLIFGIALAPLASHLFYWHHGLFMGPRMLNDYGVIWAVACALSIAGLIALSPDRMAGTLKDYSPRSFLLGSFTAAFAATAFLAPYRLRSYSVPPSPAFDTAAEAGIGTLVFIHGGWGERAAMQLAAHGMRLDQVEAALRQNSTCSVQRVIDGALPLSALDLRPRAIALPSRIEFPPGNAIRVVQGESWSPGCARQVGADSAGVIDPSLLLSRGSLPGVKSGAPLFARDLGPALNRQLERLHPDARVLLRGSDGRPALLTYAEGMKRLWKEEL